MNGADYIVEFLRQRGSDKFFLVTGGACAFIVDSIAKNPNTEYYCFQHEQAAAMAADAVYRASGKVGVSVATSGPGATNLVTGIASSYFDSIPSIHITGQVNQLESSNFKGVNVRQLGFQETDIVSMVKPITKYAVKVNNTKELQDELIKAYNIAISGRKGPVLIDVPMNVQQEKVDEFIKYNEVEKVLYQDQEISDISKKINDFFKDYKRPLILIGAGVGLGGSYAEIEDWISKSNIPFVSSWNGTTYFNHDNENFCGNIGVYGNRGANFILQNCDKLLVLGSRLDNRQRSGNPKNFAINADVMVIDIDKEELKKYRNDDYLTINFDLANFPLLIDKIAKIELNGDWMSYVKKIKNKFFGVDISEFSRKNNSLSPYLVVKKINEIIEKDSIVIADTGAGLCWIYQMFHRKKHTLFTSGGNSPMGYSVPAAIGSALYEKNRQVIAFIGDGGFQMNIQELQTIFHYNLEVKIVIFNNFGYGIIKQFQDSYCDSRHEASGSGYSVPDFEKIVKAYNVNYKKINNLDDINDDIFNHKGHMVLDVIFHPNTLIEPKLEVNRKLHDQYPYLSEQEILDNSFIK